MTGTVRSDELYVLNDHFSFKVKRVTEALKATLAQRIAKE